MEVLKTIMLMCLLVSLARETTQFAPRWNSSIRICGSNLYNYLAILCNHEYYDGSAENNQDILVRVSGLVDECCKKPCSPRELKAYCMDPSIPDDTLVLSENTTKIDDFRKTITDAGIINSTTTTTNSTSLEMTETAIPTRKSRQLNRTWE